MRTILLPVMVHIMLAVMLFTPDVARLHILRPFDAACFLAGDRTVGGDFLLHFFDSRLAFFQAPGFTLRQRARFLALLDAFLLIGFALVDALLRGWWCGGLGERGNGSGQEESNCKKVAGS